ncbi:MAG TPA: ribbon-helix-helix protein, CopG family [Thermoproteales archaeon]|nr:ribbon-helix-helix protein, CopG family [Thermoproteales archaeon]
MGVKKISVSIPEKLLKKLDEFAKSEGISRSKVITYALISYLGEYPLDEKVEKYPTVLWKLKASGGLKLRSPKRVGRRIKGEWIVEKF